MAENSKIEWTDHTWNPWRGCQKVSPGCENCYAETLANRFPGTLGEWGPPAHTTRVIAAEPYWRKPHQWNRKAEQAGSPLFVFCASLADVFEDAPQVADVRLRALAVMELTPWLTWQVLTKRPENVAGMVPSRWMNGGWPPNVWLGTSVEDQERADERLPVLGTIPAPVNFVSAEPLLGPVEVRDHAESFEWMIVGGESGPGARPMQPDWVRVIRDQCDNAEVPFLFKQWGAFDAEGVLVGKKVAGRTIDGKTWDGRPRSHIPA